ncbi:MAG: bifunctional oligoribonuclease/PAP phosphatase NrnA [Acidimicrobiia bacterium]|nr:bifunctional oligoribonuclease/PAP phosphatase NrnA [bacterium]MXX01041.1 bifunctional oligoribonuclease/PAP phosphatase NrnA [Acidimicrobiia bacterium]MYB78776.1 bifunctional oligoribonuclease/PAP phosphatase NrnA [Acidimicrobiia bacterium]MYD40543.1 bifunctional oligoribonuclease/PAP phosphatase NrnA [Acidimicrobiia bacterium]MYG91300.1 bifunctional oligoribonuclease/PAP phosphatase NrnA [Acidimicrobiia bacterium]
MSGSALSEKIREAAEVIAASRSLGGVCHERPDGDALGSMLGFAASARLAGRSVQVGIPAPGAIPSRYRFLPTDLLSVGLSPSDPPQTVLAFDCASLDRLGSLAWTSEQAENLVVVDHHVSNPGFGTIDLVDSSASATVELVFDLIAELGWPVDEVVATCLLTGLVTDTGRFQYANTTPRTHRVAARLLEAGARPEVIGQAVYEEEPFGLLSVAGAVLSRACLDTERKVVWSFLYREDLEMASLNGEETELLIDLVRLPREAGVAMLIREDDDGGVRVSLRSRGEVDVGAIAEALGGGGHRNAGGFAFEGEMSAAREAVLERVPLA